MTLYKILTHLNEYAEKHYNINEYTELENEDISTVNRKFPLMNVIPSNAAINGSLTTVTLDISFMDIELENKSNRRSVSSQMLSLCNDVVAEFFEDNEDFDIEDEFPTALPFFAINDDVLTGWTISIDVEFKSVLEPCILPIFRG